MDIEQRIREERTTWDKSRFRLMSYEQLWKLRASYEQQRQVMENLQADQRILRERIGIQRGTYLTMEGLPRRWYAIREAHSSRLSRLYDDLAAEVVDTGQALERYQDQIERLTELIDQADQETV